MLLIPVKNFNSPTSVMKIFTMKTIIIMTLMTLTCFSYQNNHLPITEYPVFINSLKDCLSEEPLGMTSGRIQDWQITASSTYPKDWDEFCGLKYARLYQPNNLAWCSKFKSTSEWLQIDLGLVSKVTGFMTQGRGDGSEWVSSYLVSHSLDGNSWSYVMDVHGNRRVFDGNSDSYKVKHAYLDEAIFAKFVKFHIVNWNIHPSLRVEIMGCQVCNNPIGHPPYVKMTSSSEKQASKANTCQSEDGHIVTKKSWCPKDNDNNQWLQFDLGPPTLITGLVTKGKGDSRKKHWVSRYLVSYSNDTSLWYYYKDASHMDVKEFGGNSDKETPRIHYLNLPFVARYVRFHPTQWNFQISMRAGLIGCPYQGKCGPDFVRITNNTPCVENLSYRKESWVNNRKPHSQSSQQQYSKRHADENWSVGQARRAVDGDGGTRSRSPTCTVLDNFNVDNPTWMVDLGKKSAITGLFIYTRQSTEMKNAETGGGHEKSNVSFVGREMRGMHREHVHNLDKLTVYVDNKGRRPENGEMGYVKNPFISQHQMRYSHHFASSENLCGSISRTNDAVFQAKLHLRCNRQMSGRYVYIEASGIVGKHKKNFAAIICEVIVYS